MPVYVFKCPQCEDLKEVARLLCEADEPEYCSRCIQSGDEGQGDWPCGERMEKQATAAGLHFKGKGWTERFYPKR